MATIEEMRNDAQEERLHQAAKGMRWAQEQMADAVSDLLLAGEDRMAEALAKVNVQLDKLVEEMKEWA